MPEMTFDQLMNDPAGNVARALNAARGFLYGTPRTDLLRSVGQTIGSVPQVPFPDKRWFQKSYGRDAPPGQDLLCGSGLFYLTEGRRLYLDCTAGHYQMTWGYAQPELTALVRDGLERGVVWDNHSNVPSATVKSLSARLIEVANRNKRSLEEARADGNCLNTVLLGVCTGTVACAAALKIMLLHYRETKKGAGDPVFVALDGNYHGTDLFAQRLRGMWPEIFANVEIAQVQPNDGEELEATFRRYGERVAAFWSEPIMMNREAILVREDYLQLARRLCDQTGALMAIDEIQTGFWYPEVMMYRQYDVEPDFVVLGKGMTAGFHPLAALLYRGKLDRLDQYDAISTNGNASLAAYVGLGCIALVERNAAQIGEVGTYFHEQVAGLCAEFPKLLKEARGKGHLTGLKFHDREDALGFHRSAVERGLWVRAHAYHEGHSAVLTKFALPLDKEVADFTIGAFRQLLKDTPWR